MNLSDYKDVYVFAEQREGKLQNVALELLGKARELADANQEKVVAMLLGKDIKPLAQTLIAHGADRVMVVDHDLLKDYMTEPYTQAITQIIEENKPSIMLIGATTIGRDLGPRVSARNRTGLTADATKLEISDDEAHEFRMTRPAFGGNLMATILCKNNRPQMSTVRPGVMQKMAADASRTGEVVEVKVNFNEQKINRVKLEHFKKYDTDDHGFIYDPDFHFTCEANTPDGAVRGPVAIGRALRKYLHDIPAYVNPASALAGAWYGQLSSFVNVSFDPALVPEELRAVWKKYDTYPGWSAMNHVAPDMTIGLELGWGGLKRKIEYWRDFNAPEDTSFYDGELEYVVGVQEWVARLAEQARAMAEASGDAEEKKNLTEIAEMNEWLVDNPPRTLREACQFIAHFQTIDRVYFLGGALDQLDELLRPW